MRIWWDGESLVSRCSSCDGAGSFSMGYCGEPHLRERCYECDGAGFRNHSWPAIRRARRARRRALLRADRQAHQAMRRAKAAIYEFKRALHAMADRAGISFDDAPDMDVEVLV